jgi:hypothetical protein
MEDGEEPRELEAVTDSQRDRTRKLKLKMILWVKTWDDHRLISQSSAELEFCKVGGKSRRPTITFPYVSS